MESRTRARVAVCVLGATLPALPALGQQEPRSATVIVVDNRPGGRGRPEPKLYWADHGANAVRRSNPDGSQLEDVVVGLLGPYGMAFDPGNRYLVWTSSGQETVQAAFVDGPSVVQLEASFEEPFAVASRQGDSDVVYAVVDGSLIRHTVNRSTGEEQLVTLLSLASPDDVHGLAVSPDGGALYLGDPYGRMSRRLSLATHNVEYLAFAEPDPHPDPDPPDPGPGDPIPGEPIP